MSRLRSVQFSYHLYLYFRNCCFHCFRCLRYLRYFRCFRRFRYLRPQDFPHPVCPFQARPFPVRPFQARPFPVRPFKARLFLDLLFPVHLFLDLLYQDLNCSCRKYRTHRMRAPVPRCRSAYLLHRPSESRLRAPVHPL